MNDKTSPASESTAESADTIIAGLEQIFSDVKDDAVMTLLLAAAKEYHLQKAESHGPDES